MSISISTFDHMPAGELSAEDMALHELGIMKTIYVPVHPRVNAIKTAYAKSVDQTIRMFQNPHKRTQDRLHEMFFDTYRQWAAPAVNIDPEVFKHQYPTNGSNEAIRESIAYFASEQRSQGNAPRIHIFDGEYEGYRAHAETHNVQVVVHDRGDYESSLRAELRANEPFYVSQPSGIDGNIWKGFDAFTRHIETHYPHTRLRADLAYLNTTATTPKIELGSPVIDMIFVSMSKSFPGTYYDRIGGVFAKTPLPGLYGNMWFKNLNGLLLGINLMQNSPLGEIPADMQKAQTKAIKRLRPVLGDDIAPSDVTFIATQPVRANPTKLQQSLLRADRIRYCLTPALIEILGT